MVGISHLLEETPECEGQREAGRLQPREGSPQGPSMRHPGLGFPDARPAGRKCLLFISRPRGWSWLWQPDLPGHPVRSSPHFTDEHREAQRASALSVVQVSDRTWTADRLAVELPSYAAIESRCRALLSSGVCPEGRPSVWTSTFLLVSFLCAALGGARGSAGHRRSRCSALRPNSRCWNASILRSYWAELFFANLQAH